ncbi:MAG: acylphosphatase [Planctomycetota bacterium]|nr:acylphosphatase [Planctomycetota bacterium]MDP6505420.1 acylphosphatase [Planctomycetota bacterium]
MAQTVRLTVHFSGMVQGVGFRYTTARVARTFQVTGYVKNLSDGRVELVAEGESDELSRFRASVEKAMHGYISNVEKTTEEAESGFTGFGVRY